MSKRVSSKRLILLVICLVLLIWLGGSIWLSDKYTVPVLMYHNVAESQTFKDDTVSPRNFEWQMAYLRKQGYQILSLSDLVSGLKNGKKFPHHCVAITFDDGYKNNYTAAFPILKKYNIPANFFVSPGTVGEDGSLTWDDVLTMHKAGMSFGSHGMIQSYLPEVPKEKQIYEIWESKKILEEKLKEKIKFYAYPIGGFNREIKQLMRDAGYEAAFTTNRGTDRFDHDLYEINRIRAGDHDTNGLIFGAKISGYYNLFRKLKKEN